MGGDYHKDFDDGLTNMPLGDPNTLGYADGQRERERRQQTPSGSAWGGAPRQMTTEFKENPVKFYVKWLAQTVAYAAGAGALGFVFGILSSKPSGEAIQWAVIAAGIMTAFSLVILTAFTVGVLLGFALNIAVLPLVLWRWLLAFGVLGAAVGYFLATTASNTSSEAQQQAIEFGIRGVVVGFAVGIVYRLLKRLTRRGQQRSTGPTAGA